MEPVPVLSFVMTIPTRIRALKPLVIRRLWNRIYARNEINPVLFGLLYRSEGLAPAGPKSDKRGRGGGVGGFWGGGVVERGGGG
jgi:hypothetical protein